MRSTRRFVFSVILLAASVALCSAQQFDPALYQEMRWRSIGPFRGGRTVAISGVPGQPNVFFMAPNNGGVWKSTDGAATWTPLTDGQPSLAIGALAVLPGPPDTIYVGTGEGNNGCDNQYGQGILESSDGGISWTQLGAATFDRDTFTRIAVQQTNPTVLYAATSFGYSNGAAGECFPVFHAQHRALQIERRRADVDVALRNGWTAGGSSRGYGRRVRVGL